MKNHALKAMVATTCALCAGPVVAQSNTNPSQVEVASYVYAYELGLQIGQDLEQITTEDRYGGILSHLPSLREGLFAGIANQPPKYSDAQLEAARSLIEAARHEERDRQIGLLEELTELQRANAEQEVQFFKDLDARKDVRKDPSGVYFRITRKGDGTYPSTSDTISVHYAGTFIDGTQFDSSYDRGEPAEFHLGGLIEGWQIGIPKIQVGGKGTLYIPSSLGYGEQGRCQDPNDAEQCPIPPASTLIFDIEVLEITDSN